MGKVSLEVYLFFDGTCKEAMNFYKGIFGGELQISTYADSPPSPQTEGVDPDRVMHATLDGGDIKLMASDSPKASKTSAKVELSLGGTDAAHMHKIFDTLAAGGKVKMPLAKQFWGDTFGMLSDKFGVDWMVNIGTDKS
jgi:PhnB protein